MWEAETQHVNDFWIFGPMGTLSYGFEYTNLLLKYKKTYGNMSPNIIFLISRFGTSNNCFFGKCGGTNNEYNWTFVFGESKTVFNLDRFEEKRKTWWWSLEKCFDKLES